MTSLYFAAGTVGTFFSAFFIRDLIISATHSPQLGSAAAIAMLVIGQLIVNGFHLVARSISNKE